MNRRSFVLTGASAIAMFGNAAAAQRTGTSNTVAISEFTGAEIDYTDSSFTLADQNFEPNAGETTSFGWEQFKFITGGGELTLDLFTSGSQDFPQYMREYTETWTMIFDVEEYAYADIEDGGYSAFGFDTSIIYLEYQYGAFPDVDFMVTLLTDQATFQDEFARLQSIMVGGAPPCIFTAESEIESIQFDSAEPTAAVASRTTRNSTTGQTSQTNTGSTTSAATDSDYVDTIVAQREDFLDSYDAFMGKLTIVGDETTSDADKTALFGEMYDLAVMWKSYPADAEALTVPAGLESLGVIYTDWATVIGEMGTLFEQLYSGTNTTDAFIAALTKWETLDAQLAIEIEDYSGSAPSPGIPSVHSLVSGFRTG